MSQALHDAILPCPFCGGEAFPSSRQTPSTLMLHWIECSNCDARGGSCSTPDAAATWWNARAGTAPHLIGDGAEPVARVFLQSSNGSAGVMWLDDYQPNAGDLLYATPSHPAGDTKVSGDDADGVDAKGGA